MKKTEENFCYQPAQFLDGLIARLGVHSSSALARVVGLSPSIISKVRHQRLAISSEILLKIHESTDIPIRELRRMMGDNRKYFSPFKGDVARYQTGVRTRPGRPGLATLPIETSQALPRSVRPVELHGNHASQ